MCRAFKLIIRINFKFLYRICQAHLKIEINAFYYTFV